MKIYFAPYTLKGVRRLNSQAQSLERKGALLRVEWTSFQVGFADVFPWPELGDVPLERQLEFLKDRKLTPLLQQSLSFAEKDAQARSFQQNLFAGLQVPPSHLLWLETGSDLGEYWARGFRTIKLKFGRSLEEALSLIARIPEKWKLRVDSNHCLAKDEAMQWAQALTRFSQIEFWEDPTPYDPHLWRELNDLVPLAFDFGDNPQGGFHVLIHKPAVQAEPLGEGVVCVTSYMDHPVGQCFAALRAGELARHRRVIECGLQSHHAYEGNEFSEAWSLTPQFTPPPGFGIGFDEQLERQQWTSLS